MGHFLEETAQTVSAPELFPVLSFGPGAASLFMQKKIPNFKILLKNQGMFANI